MAVAKRSAGIVLALLAWALLAHSGLVPAEYFPPPLAVAVAGWGLLTSADFLAQVGVTCLRMIVGLLAAMGAGVAIAIATGRYQLLYRMLEPVVGMLRALPPPAIVPISIFAFGIGPGLFIFIITFAAFWPIYMNAANALHASEPVQILTGRSLGYSRWEILLRLRLPAAMPEVITGIRVGAGIALLATVAAEMLAGQSGLGFLLYDAAFTLRTADMFAIMVVIGILGLLLNTLVRQASRLAIGWHLSMTALGGSA